MNAAWRWISLPATLAIHDAQIAEHGGPPGVRDIDLLISALERPRNLAAYSPQNIEAHKLAAAYAWGIARNHPFIDGNKRTAYVVSFLFLSLHGIGITASRTERVRIFQNLAEGGLDQNELADWFREHSI